MFSFISVLLLQYPACSTLMQKAIQHGENMNDCNVNQSKLKANKYNLVSTGVTLTLAIGRPWQQEQRQGFYPSRQRKVSTGVKVGCI